MGAVLNLKKLSGTSEVSITPRMAEEFLQKSAGNRNIGDDRVKLLAGRMARGEWAISEICFDDKGRFVDGHHRMRAVMLYGKPVTFRVRQGVSASELYLIDDVRRRSITDQIKMFRPKTDFINNRVAAVNVCAKLLVGGAGRSFITNLEEYDGWYSFFKPGLDWAVPGLWGSKYARQGPVAGALAFAHKADPKRIEKFGEQLRDGEELAKTDAAYVLRKRLVESLGHQRGTNSARLELAGAVLNAAWCHLNGQALLQVRNSHDAVRYFVSQYDKASVTKLLDRMLPYRAVSK